MATHASAEKAAKQSAKRALRNQSIRSEFKTAIKKLNTVVGSAKKLDKEYLQSQVMPAFNEVQKLLMRAGSKNIIHRNQASRKISRLSLAINKVAKA